MISNVVPRRRRRYVKVPIPDTSPDDGALDGQASRLEAQVTTFTEACPHAGCGGRVRVRVMTLMAALPVVLSIVVVHL